MKSKILAEFSLSLVLSLSSLVVVAVPTAHANSINSVYGSSSVNPVVVISLIITLVLASKIMNMKRT